jgi:hypothetical protein
MIGWRRRMQKPMRRGMEIVEDRDKGVVPLR